MAGQSETQQLPFFSLTILIPQDEFIEDVSNHLIWNLYHIGISAEIKTVSDVKNILEKSKDINYFFINRKGKEFIVKM